MEEIDGRQIEVVGHIVGVCDPLAVEREDDVSRLERKVRRG
jgi:hypothetical protein